MYERILVPVDGSETSNAGLGEAIRIAKSCGAQIRLLHAIDEMPLVMGFEGYAALSTDLMAALKKAGEDILQQCRDSVTGNGVAADAVLVDRFSGRLCDLVAAEAQRWPADLIVLGTHGRRGVGRLMLGSDAEQILRTAPTSVLLVRAGAPGPAR